METAPAGESTLPQDEKVSILLVDDLPEKLLVYETILEELGQNLVMARSGEEALRLVLKQEFAVILLDVNMPGVDGFETASLIRQRKKSAHTPIIFLTAFNDEMRMAQGYASGAVDYLPTPVVPEILRAKIRVFIELSQMRRQAALQAKEHALRTAAEESSRRSSFLVTASEQFSRAHRPEEILELMATLPLGPLAEKTFVWLDDAERFSASCRHGWLEAGTNRFAPAPQSHAGSAVRAAIGKSIASEQPVVFSSPDGDSLKGMDAGMAVPFTGQVKGALVLARAGHTSGYAAGDASLASDLVSRASVALENTLLVERIQEGDHRKDEFLATLAHELRNPLAPIRNALQVMRLSGDAVQRQEAQDTIERQLTQMIHLIDDLMDVSRITQGKVELRKQPVMLNPMLQHAIETVQPHIEQRNHQLSVTLPSAPLWLNADTARISQIFSNLLNNAAKYTGRNGRIDLTAQQLDGWAVITVSDNGIGIPAPMLSRIFDMFSQVDSSLERSEGGLGIGLTLVRSFIQMHGGTIEVTSEGVNQGSRFVVRLPIIESPQAEEALPSEPEPVKAGDHLRVLVVDDNEASAKTLGWMMEIFGHQIELAHDGQAALELARSHIPDVILLDIGLPGMNGYELCKRMREEPSLKNAVFIAQTGWGQSEHRQRSKEAGFDHHLVKPIDMKMLENVLGEVSRGT